jgi:CRP-like cAMP-binding protein
VRRGVLVRTRASARGPAISIDCAGTGALVPWPATVPEIGYAATDLLVCLYPREGLESALAREPETAREILAGLASALDRVERLAEARGQATAEERVSRVLEVLAETLSPPVRRERLPSALQQRDLARLAGVRHESFCRILGKLERVGVVRRGTEGLAIGRVERDVVAGA